MIGRKTAILIHIVLLAAWHIPETAQSAERIPILLDTDAGTGIEDAFALGLAFGSEELNVRGVTTVGDDTHNRAMMMCRFLTATGRKHTPVAEGAKPQPSRPITDQSKYYYHPDPLFDRTIKPDKKPAAEFLYDRLKQQPGKVSLVALGPLTNIARLLETHGDAAELVRSIVLLESNIALDVEAARSVFAAEVPLVMVAKDAYLDLQLDQAGVKRVFSPGTALTRQVQTLYQMWDRQNPPLCEALAVALCFEERFAKSEQRSLALDENGKLITADSASRAKFVTSVKSDEFAKWYVDRMASLVNPADKPSRLIEDDRMPHRVHVAEDFDTDIERFWWMSGKPETKLLPAGSRRACRSVLTHDFDALLMPSRQMDSAVIFNPVPGPVMGKNTRLRFRYWLKETGALRVQIYSLSNGYHRQLVVKNLPQQTWQTATVDMTEARRPDGTGGPLSENERIDDIQFYVDPDAQVVIDDIVLYDAGPKNEQRLFPKRILFTGHFDTGRKDQRWPGDFKIVPDAGNFWRAAQSVQNAKTGKPWIRLHLRGQRTLGERTQLSFRFHLAGADEFEVQLFDTKTGEGQSMAFTDLTPDVWSHIAAEIAPRRLKSLKSIDEIRFHLPKGAELLIDDVLLYEPASQSSPKTKQR